MAEDCIVEEFKALLTNIVRRRERMSSTEPVAIGVGGALDHVAGARNRIASLHIKAGCKVPPLGGAVQLPARDACAQGRGRE